ncbi:SigE family RNA polymerase sigma factor [Catellatospora citrea]|uniref:RNA polymerase sigma24 factor n=1 Tax=Catellatospora citrea TaxID=53366 RepID=A0A8J3KAF0_9ACTN|nr:SigE family RNA polymerase sigma factor [Catellatospora citrea]RKE09215.1 RNA polymerase sigma-70 factor (sigma-E family) [Catellatospora citrea]GIF99606.1 RNA polymerase sigma24 factor [Catellatospora citrea]
MSQESDDDFAEYVSARLVRLHRTAYFLCGDTHTADDVVQATLLSLYGRWRHARSAENLDGYVYRIMTRRFLDLKRSRWARVLLRETVPERSHPADDSVEQRSSLIAALQQLPPGQRAVLVLRYFSDLSVEATAQALGCSAGNVKSQSSRGLATLRTILAVPEPAGATHRRGH